MPKSCPSGKIKRESYTTKKGKKVKASCVKNKGLPGKTKTNKKVLPKLKKGYLTKYGYQLSNNYKKREDALRKAMKGEGDLEVLRRVVVLRTYMKNEPSKFKKLDKDVKYIQKIRKDNKKTKRSLKTKNYNKLKSVLKKKSKTKKSKTKKSKVKKRVRFSL